MNVEDTFIDSAESVKKRVKIEKGITTKEKEVRDIMKNQLGMRFRKLKLITNKTNSINNLVLR